MVNTARDALRAALAAQANPERAAAQQRYMKSTLPYHGLSSSEVRAVARTIWAEHRFTDPDQWQHAILSIWEEATHREEWYAAIALARHRCFRSWARDVASLTTWRHLVETGAWWDVVDEIATHLVGDALRAHPEEVAPIMREWSRDQHLWVRRTSILSQLSFGAATDTDLLDYCLAGSLDDANFFARKAIGWALRQYARTDPRWVRDYVTTNDGRLSGLSKREAFKHLGALPTP